MKKIFGLINSGRAAGGNRYGDRGGRTNPLRRAEAADRKPAGLLSGRKMLILDEAFASLDVERRQRLLEVLEKRRWEQFLLLVTHERGVESLNKGAVSFDMRKINQNG